MNYESSPLIITGMHRSATSLVASLFEKAGVPLGEQLLAPDARNPRGFFEDVDFYEFHESALHARGQTILVTREFTFTPTPAEDARAAQLIAQRAAQPLWGWKDPRTCLFLDFWRAQLPHAHFLLLYRHPLDVLLSLMRRQDTQLNGLLEGLEAWYAYNHALAEFHARHPAAALLCHSYAVVDAIAQFNARLRARFGLELQLDASVRDARYQPGELRRAAIGPAVETLLQEIHPDALALYARLNASADLPFVPPPDQAVAASPALSAFADWAAAQPDASVSARRGMLFLLLGLLEPETLEGFVQRQGDDLRHLIRNRAWLERERAGWENLARERERIILEQQAWAQERMEHLRQLEANPFVRALRRVGLVGRGKK